MAELVAHVADGDEAVATAPAARLKAGEVGS
jgi:hypothetical protein